MGGCKEVSRKRQKEVRVSETRAYPIVDEGDTEDVGKEEDHFILWVIAFGGCDVAIHSADLFKLAYRSGSASVLFCNKRSGRTPCLPVHPRGGLLQYAWIQAVISSERSFLDIVQTFEAIVAKIGHIYDNRGCSTIVGCWELGVEAVQTLQMDFDRNLKYPLYITRPGTIAFYDCGDIFT